MSESGLVKVGFTASSAEYRLMSISSQVKRTLNVLAIFRSNHREELRTLRRLRHLCAECIWGKEWHHPGEEIRAMVSRVSVDEYAEVWARLGLRLRVGPLVRVAS
jgi:hypothetical protein